MFLLVAACLQCSKSVTTVHSCVIFLLVAACLQYSKSLSQLSTCVLYFYWWQHAYNIARVCHNCPLVCYIFIGGSMLTMQQESVTTVHLCVIFLLVAACLQYSKSLSQLSTCVLYFYWWQHAYNIARVCHNCPLVCYIFIGGSMPTIQQESVTTVHLCVIFLLVAACLQCSKSLSQLSTCVLYFYWWQHAYNVARVCHNCPLLCYIFIGGSMLTIQQESVTTVHSCVIFLLVAACLQYSKSVTTVHLCVIFLLVAACLQYSKSLSQLSTCVLYFYWWQHAYNVARVCHNCPLVCYIFIGGSMLTMQQESVTTVHLCVIFLLVAACLQYSKSLSQLSTRVIFLLVAACLQYSKSLSQLSTRVLYFYWWQHAYNIARVCHNCPLVCYIFIGGSMPTIQQESVTTVHSCVIFLLVAACLQCSKSLSQLSTCVLYFYWWQHAYNIARVCHNCPLVCYIFIGGSMLTMQQESVTTVHLCFIFLLVAACLQYSKSLSQLSTRVLYFYWWQHAYNIARVCHNCPLVCYIFIGGSMLTIQQESVTTVHLCVIFLLVAACLQCSKSLSQLSTRVLYFYWWQHAYNVARVCHNCPLVCYIFIGGSMLTIQQESVTTVHLCVIFLLVAACLQYSKSLSQLSTRVLYFYWWQHAYNIARVCHNCPLVFYIFIGGSMLTIQQESVTTVHSCVIFLLVAACLQCSKSLSQLSTCVLYFYWWQHAYNIARVCHNCPLVCYIFIGGSMPTIQQESVTTVHLCVIFLLVAACLQYSKSLSQLSTRVLYFYWWQHAYNIARVCHNCPLVCYIFIGGSMLTMQQESVTTVHLCVIFLLVAACLQCSKSLSQLSTCVLYFYWWQHAYNVARVCHNCPLVCYIFIGGSMLTMQQESVTTVHSCVIFLLVAACLQCSKSLSQLSTRVLYFYWWQHAYNVARVCHNCPLVCYIFIGGSMLTIQQESVTTVHWCVIFLLVAACLQYSKSLSQLSTRVLYFYWWQHAYNIARVCHNCPLVCYIFIGGSMLTMQQESVTTVHLCVIFLLVAACLQYSKSLSQLSTRVLYFYWWQHAYNIARVCHNCPLLCYIFIGGSMLTMQQESVTTVHSCVIFLLVAACLQYSKSLSQLSTRVPGTGCRWLAVFTQYFWMFPPELVPYNVCV